MKNEPKFFAAVHETVRRIPRGSVASYGQIAAMLGRPRAARFVGYAMRQCPPDYPWHRVVREDGTVLHELQRVRLIMEGVTFDERGRINVSRHRWSGEALSPVRVTVAAAIIENARHEILVCRRAKDSQMGGLWEFPGGKLENGETLKECVVRECMEELGVQIRVRDIFAETEYDYPERTIKFTFFKAAIVSGEPEMLVHDDMRWVSRNSLAELKFCPADIEVIERLCEK